MKLLTLTLGLPCLVSAFAGNFGRGQKLATRQSTTLPYTPHYFDQQIDHFQNSSRYTPNSNATYKQRYYMEPKYYKPGGPVILFLGGETPADEELPDLRPGAIIQLLMEKFNGVGIILENRYYGTSYPFNTSTTDELRFLTTEQTIADTANFVQNVVLPGFNSSMTAPDYPWLVYGASLPGAQAAFVMKTYNHLFAGGIAASGVTKAKLAYPEWYDPIQKWAPQDCVGSLNAIVDKIDHVFTHGNASQINHMKSIFGLETLKNNGDFAQTIAYPLGGPYIYPTNTWQELSWYPPRAHQDFWYFCRNITNANAPKNVTSLDHALAPYTNGKSWTNLGNYANYIKQYLIPTCDGAPINSTDCFLRHDQAYWANTTNTYIRSYLYTTCIESGAYIAAHQDKPSLVSRVLTPAYTQQWCTWAFPPGKYNTIPDTPDLERYEKYGGYSVEADRLAHIDGEQDVWRDVCYHSVDAPQRYTLSAEDAYLRPHLLLETGGHHWDSSVLNDTFVGEPQFIREAHLWEMRIVTRWLEMFEEKKKAKAMGKRDEL